MLQPNVYIVSTSSKTLLSYEMNKLSNTKKLTKTILKALVGMK